MRKLMSSAEDELPLRVFKQFMACERLDSLKKRLEQAAEHEDYDRCAVIRDLIAEREGKLEIRTEDNVLVHFDIAPAS